MRTFQLDPFNGQGGDDTFGQPDGWTDWRRTVKHNLPTFSESGEIKIRNADCQKVHQSVLLLLCKPSSKAIFWAMKMLPPTSCSFNEEPAHFIRYAALASIIPNSPFSKVVCS
jgi:hypothetical protein